MIGAHPTMFASQKVNINAKTINVIKHIYTHFQSKCVAIIFYCYTSISRRYVAANWLNTDTEGS